MALPSKTLWLNLTTAIAISALLSGCSDERGFKPKAFPKSVVLEQGASGSRNAGDRSVFPDVNSVYSPEATTEQRDEQIHQANETIADVSEWYQEYKKNSGSQANDKLDEIMSQLTEPRIAMEVIKGLSIITTPNFEVMAKLNINGSSKVLLANGEIDLADKKQTMTQLTTQFAQEGAADNVEAYAVVCGTAKCAGLVRVFLKITIVPNKPIYAVFAQTAKEDVVNSSLGNNFPSYKKAEGIVQADEGDESGAMRPAVPGAPSAGQRPALTGVKPTVKADKYVDDMHNEALNIMNGKPASEQQQKKQDVQNDKTGSVLDSSAINTAHQQYLQKLSTVGSQHTASMKRPLNAADQAYFEQVNQAPATEKVAEGGKQQMASIKTSSVNTADQAYFQQVNEAPATDVETIDAGKSSWSWTVDELKAAIGFAKETKSAQATAP